ncbi:hypothetical protein GGR55DRAFT_176474 [Xylaria sp. FL0064]|nr:hypothetical protein GGR55DRAFT_176474 [Xylaria sp. FL0064]
MVRSAIYSFIFTISLTIRPSLRCSTSRACCSSSSSSFARAPTSTTYFRRYSTAISKGTWFEPRKSRGRYQLALGFDTGAGLGGIFGANCEYRLMGIFWKAARIGERLSPYISLCCVFMAVR